MRQTITLACAETGERLYLTSKKTNEIHQKKITAEKNIHQNYGAAHFSLKSNNRRKT